MTLNITVISNHVMSIKYAVVCLKCVGKTARLISWHKMVCEIWARIMANTLLFYLIVLSRLYCGPKFYFRICHENSLPPGLKHVSELRFFLKSTIYFSSTLCFFFQILIHSAVGFQRLGIRFLHQLHPTTLF